MRQVGSQARHACTNSVNSVHHATGSPRPDIHNDKLTLINMRQGSKVNQQCCSQFSLLRFGQKNECICCLMTEWSLVTFPIHHRLFSLKFIFCGRSSLINNCLPSKVIFHYSSAFIEHSYQSNVFLHQRSPSIEGCLPSKFVIHQWLSSIESYPPTKVVFYSTDSMFIFIII